MNKSAPRMNGCTRVAVVTITIVITLIVLNSAALFRTQSIKLTAEPGKTAMVEMPEYHAPLHNNAWLGNQEIPIKGFIVPNPEDYSVHQYTCENGSIEGMRTERISIPFQLYLTNNCDQTVTIEIWWYESQFINSLF